MSNPRSPGLGMTFLVGGVLLIALMAASVLIPVDCPDCRGGTLIRESIGIIPCDTCRENHRVSVGRAWWYRIVRVAR
jgi:hypothetical protein